MIVLVVVERIYGIVAYGCCSATGFHNILPANINRTVGDCSSAIPELLLPVSVDAIQCDFEDATVAASSSRETVGQELSPGRSDPASTETEDNGAATPSGTVGLRTGVALPVSVSTISLSTGSTGLQQLRRNMIEL